MDLPCAPEIGFLRVRGRAGASSEKRSSVRDTVFGKMSTGSHTPPSLW